MFSQDQINVLWHLVEKGVVAEQDVKNFLLTKLKEVGFVETPPPAPEVPAEPAPPAPEAAPEQPAA